VSGSRTLRDAATATATATEVRPVQLPHFEKAPAVAAEQADIGRLMDVDLRMTVELGSTTRTIREVLDIDAGAVIELDQLAGEPVAILVNHKPIARGEVVVIDNNFGVRVTEIVGRADQATQEEPAAIGHR